MWRVAHDRVRRVGARCRATRPGQCDRSRGAAALAAVVTVRALAGCAASQAVAVVAGHEHRPWGGAVRCICLRSLGVNHLRERWLAHALHSESRAFRRRRLRRRRPGGRCGRRARRRSLLARSCIHPTRLAGPCHGHTLEVSLAGEAGVAKFAPLDILRAQAPARPVGAERRERGALAVGAIHTAVCVVWVGAVGRAANRFARRGGACFALSAGGLGLGRGGARHITSRRIHAFHGRWLGIPRADTGAAPRPAWGRRRRLRWGGAGFDRLASHPRGGTEGPCGDTNGTNGTAWRM